MKRDFVVFIGYGIVATAIARAPNEVVSVAYKSKQHNTEEDADHQRLSAKWSQGLMIQEFLVLLKEELEGKESGQIKLY